MKNAEQGSFRILARELSRELTPAEMDSVGGAGGTGLSTCLKSTTICDMDAWEDWIAD